MMQDRHPVAADAGPPHARSRTRAARRGGYTLTELLVGLAVGLVIVAVLYAVLSLVYRAGDRADAEGGSALELTELLEHLCQDLRDADELAFEETRDVTTLRLVRKGPEGPAAVAAYEVTGAGRRVSRRAPPDRRRDYDFTRGPGETDPLMLELSADRRTLFARGLGLRLHLPTPEARAALSSAGGAASASGRDGGGPDAGGAAPEQAPQEFAFGPAPAPSSGAVPDGADLQEAPGSSAEPGGASDFPEPLALAGTGVPMEGDAHPMAVLYRFAGGGDEAPIPGVDPAGRRFGFYESRSNLGDAEGGQPLLFLRGARGERDPVEPMYVLPDPATGRMLAGGTPDDSWPGIAGGPGLGSGGPGPRGPDPSAGTDTEGSPPSASGGRPGPVAVDPRRAAPAPDRLTLDRALAAAITGDDTARQALLDTLRDMRGLPAGAGDAILEQVATGIDQARENIEARRAQSGEDPEGEFGPLSRTTSVERQVLANMIRREQGLSESEEEAAARAVEDRRRNPAEPAEPPAPAAPDSPPPAAEPPPAQEPPDGR
ncbi:MAG: prepilin-type N-terminal cleavage/methylation domain-containing protein [Candidatus Wallbacteria bacterium]|nr:prepilin-type N-terminal cleavage/methylation domain-containing protein [Candidatus Wallbacteria bacterium]